MENASKALIIAGAILLSILIIGLGMGVYNNAKSSMGTANMDSNEVKAHNSQFLSYEGRQKGAEINSLISLIKKNNKDYEDRLIKINFNNTTDPVSNPQKATASTKYNADLTTLPTGMTVKPTTTYYVTFGYSDNACISGCEIHVYSEDCGSETINFTDMT